MSAATPKASIRRRLSLAEKLGLRPEVTDVRFPSIVPGIATAASTSVPTSYPGTAERERSSSSWSIFRSYLGLLVRRGITGIDVNHLCGRTLALTQGSAQIKDRRAALAAMRGARGAEIRFLFFPNSADTYLAVRNGRGDGFLTGRPSASDRASMMTACT